MFSSPQDKSKIESKPLSACDVGSFAEAAECLRTLAHPVRLRMVQMLLQGRYSVGELAADAGVADHVASEHLRLMKRCGFFTCERDGRKVYYRVAEAHLRQLMGCLENRFLARPDVE